MSRACWDCGHDEFRIHDDGLDVLAECTECGGRAPPGRLFDADGDHGREYYGIQMSSI